MSSTTQVCLGSGAGVDVDPVQLLANYRRAETEGEKVDLRNRLLVIYLPSCTRVAVSFKKQLPQHCAVEDLAQEAIFGLLDAFDTFDNSKGVAFNTFANYRMRGAILDYIRSQDWVPRLDRSRANKLRRARNDIYMALGKEPDVFDLARHFKCSLQAVRDLCACEVPPTTFSLSDAHPSNGTDEGGLDNSELIADLRQFNPARVALAKLEAEEFLSQFEGRDLEIIRLYLVEQLTMKQIGKELRITESRVCQVIKGLREKVAALEV